MVTETFLEAVRPLTIDRPVLANFQRALNRLGLPLIGDSCRDVHGMTSPRKLQLLNLAVRQLPTDGTECYFEVGTFQGKSLIGALLGNPRRRAVACDNFTLFDEPGNPKNKLRLEQNLARYGLGEQVQFYDCDFEQLIGKWSEQGFPPIGVYFYDGAHDEDSQYRAVRLIEPLLARRAIVIIDDWRYAPDSQSRAEAGTKRALAESSNAWRIEHVLPARRNGDVGAWWNGVCVLSFEDKGS
jgi:predicted O-methyltransferase YrrM